MDSYSDSNSSQQEELPVFDSLQLHLCASHTENFDLGGAEEAVISSSVKGNVGACTAAKADILMISSESDDDAPYVPLAQRLKQKQDNVISTIATVANSKQHSPSSMVNAQLPCQINLPESEPPLDFHAVGTVNSDVSGGVVAHHQRWLPLKHHSGLRITQTSPVKWTVKKIQATREEALKRRQARERQKSNKDALRQEQAKQKVERKALSEAAKAMRPEESIKHMVVAVDPGEEEKYLTQCRCEWQIPCQMCPVDFCGCVEDNVILQIKPVLLYFLSHYTSWLMASLWMGF